MRSRSGWSPTTPPLFVVVDNGQDVTVNFGNFKEGTIAGLIYEDLNRNGQKDANEPAADGQRVFLDIGADTTLDQDFIVGADGQYSFTGLGPGTYQVSLALPAGWEQTTGAPAPISMLSGAFNQVDFGLFDWNNVTFDLDVDNDFRLGNTFFDGTTDGLANYTPGYEGNSAVDLFATGRAGQQVRLVLTNVGKDAGVARVEFEILASTALPGYAVNATDRRIVAGRNDDDFSFRKQTNLRKANIVANLRGPVPRLGQAIHQSLGSIEDNESWVNLWVKDYGGEAIIEARLFDADGKRIQTPRRLLVGIPIDEDGNGMADVWERAKLQEWNQQYQGDVPRTPFGGGGIFFRIEDSEKADPDGANGPLVPQASGGDHIPVIDEYRGFILGGSARFRGAEPSHVRLSPARKEVLLEVDLSHSLPNSDRIALDKYFENARTVYSRVGIDLYWIFQGAFVNEHNLDFENVGGATDLKGHKIGLQTALNVSRGKTTSRGNADLPQFLLDNYKSYFTHVAAVRDIDNLPANVGSFSFDTGMPDRMGVYLVTAGAERLAESVGISDPAEAGGIVLAHEIMHLLINPTKPSAIWDDKEHLAAVPHTELMDWNRTEENLTLATVTVGQATQSELDLVGNPTLHAIRQIRDLRDELK